MSIPKVVRNISDVAGKTSGVALDATPYVTANGATDNTASIQALINEAVPGARIALPQGRIRFTTLVINKPITLEGRGGYARISLAGTGRWGDAGYGAGTYESGTVLECTATSGVAIDITSAADRIAPVTIRNLALVGVGNTTRTTVGIAWGTPAVGTHFHRLDNVHVANFKVGLRLRTSYFSTITAMNFVGCAKAILLENSANANWFFGVTAELCGETGGSVLDLDQVTECNFTGLCLEGCSGKIIYLHNSAENNHFTSGYLENYGTQGATHAIHAEFGSDDNVFDSPHIGGDATGATVLIAGARNTLRAVKYAEGPITLSGAMNVFDSPVLPTGAVTTSYPMSLRLHRPAVTLTAASSPFTPTLVHETLYANTAGGSITVNLPPVATSIGRRLNIKKISAANSLVIDANAAEIIDSTTLYTITAIDEGRMLECDGSTWRTVGRTF